MRLEAVHFYPAIKRAIVILRSNILHPVWCRLKVSAASFVLLAGRELFPTTVRYARRARAWLEASEGMPISISHDLM